MRGGFADAVADQQADTGPRVNEARQVAERVHHDRQSSIAAGLRRRAEQDRLDLAQIEALPPTTAAPGGLPLYTRYMASEAAAVERALLALSEHERAAVIYSGLLSLDGGLGPVEQREVDGAWRGEVGDRLDDVLSGRVELGTFEQTQARFAAKYPAPTE